jgi:hypothetical protein
MPNQMKQPLSIAALVVFSFCPCFGAAADPVPPLAETGFHEVFDGKTLNGWDCDADFWRVENGTMIGESKVDHQPKQNTFCIWKGGQPGDFDLKAEFKLTGTTDGNSGFQYRSEELPQVARWVLKGYQYDIDLKQNYTGQVYEERGRGFLALRGQIAEVPENGKAGSIGSLGEAADLRHIIHDNDWNEIEIIAHGNTLIQLLNGRVTSIVVDNDPAHRKMKGEIGVQMHRLPGVAMKIETRHIRLKTF